MFIVYIEQKALLLRLKHVVLEQMKQYEFSSWKTKFTQLEVLLSALEAAEDTDALDPDEPALDWLKPKTYTQWKAEQEAKPDSWLNKPAVVKSLLRKLRKTLH